MAPTQMTVVAGSPTTVADLGKDEAWLKEWLAEDPARLGIGDVTILERDPVKGEDGNPAFLAGDSGRYFSVNVMLGELDASQGFNVLDSWARNRVRHPDKTHVAVIVTETATGRYHTALEALAEHLPIVVVELQAWRGKAEAMIVPRVALASGDLRFSRSTATSADAAEPSPSDDQPGVSRPAEADKPEAAGVKAPEATDGDRDLGDPWKLPKRDAAPVGANGALQPSSSSSAGS